MILQTFRTIAYAFKEHWQLITTITISSYTALSIFISKYTFSIFNADYTVFLDFVDLYWFALRVLEFERMLIIIISLIILALLLVHAYHFRKSVLENDKKLLEAQQKSVEEFIERFKEKKASYDVKDSIGTILEMQKHKASINRKVSETQKLIEGKLHKKDQLVLYAMASAVILFSVFLIGSQIKKVGRIDYFPKYEIKVKIKTNENKKVCGRVIFNSDKHIVIATCKNSNIMAIINSSIIEFEQVKN
ncbi:hypothetical protein [Pseudoalteromonas sp. NJ631]|uniref:hypothetical protein n=1 Tax=Pseudoalteromonas sp. NJ631 TaxID=493915 RepID=UPI0002D2BF16|nr:hypothetical protein [Pseudoalteromonas sp. NJ631]